MSMMQILNRYDRSVIFEGEYATIRLCVEAAVAQRKNLSGADLSGADLSGANLYGANLYGANLYGADLSRADLSGANLSGARGASAQRTTPLLMLRDQPDRIRLYKLVKADGTSPMASMNGYKALTYEIGQTYEIPDANTDESIDCAHGLHVATLDWCLKNWQEGYRVFVVEFTAADIAAIPIASDGKIRVFRFTVVGEKTQDELGLTKEKAEREAWEAPRLGNDEHA